MKQKMIAVGIFYFCMFLVSARQTDDFVKAKKPKKIVLYNGKNLQYWQGDMNVWHIENEFITAGDTGTMHLQNDFLATKKDYSNFILTLKFKLEGGPGFVNSGVQVNSQRNTVAPLNEMVGFQADIGPGYTGSLYDETRRDIILAKADSSIVENLLNKSDWNDYEIRCINRRIVILLNGTQTIDYTEPKNEYPDFGKIGLQIHGNAKMKISFKDIILYQY